MGGLGFRDLETFNVSLLTKMAWRAQQHPDAFWVRVLKGIFFPITEFLKAVKGARASWAWSSLLVGRDTLLNGGLWKIGNGETVDICNDAWIPNLPGLK
jgi:hypothetical protein